MRWHWPSHDGIYLWGKEKVVAVDQEHPYLTTFKRQRYGGKSIASELARRGYVTMAIDMFFWGERRILRDDDPPAYRDRPPTMSEQDIRAFNQRGSQDESPVGRRRSPCLLLFAVLAAGSTESGDQVQHQRVELHQLMDELDVVAEGRKDRRKLLRQHG